MSKAGAHGMDDKDRHNLAGLKRVVFACDCDECECCGEPVCPACQVHYGECGCPGPTQDDEYDYVEVDGVLYARPICEEEEA